MSKPSFKIGDRVVCVNSDWAALVVGGVYVVKHVFNDVSNQFVVLSDDDRNMYLSSRFIYEQDTPCPSLADDYPESSEDYEHNKPHHVIVWGAASLLIWLAFFAGLWCGWAWL